jgi:hypothetical protein
MFYPTTLLPPSLPYPDSDSMITALCDRCLARQDDDTISELDKQQLFDLTMALVEFWETEGVL